MILYRINNMSGFIIGVASLVTKAWSWNNLLFFIMCKIIYFVRNRNTQKTVYIFETIFTYVSQNGTVRNQTLSQPILPNVFPKKLTKLLYNRELYIISTINPIRSIKNWGKPSCMLCMKERIQFLKILQLRYSLLSNSWSEVYDVCHHIIRLHRFTWH